MEILISVGLFVLGACMGSFVCCQVWRMRKGDKSRWSHCFSCGKRIAWYDNVPVVSWLVLRGKCRKCGKKIGVAEILSEVLMGLVFVGVWWLWPTAANDGEAGTVALMAVFLAMLVGMAVLFIYDMWWRELPVGYLTFCVFCATLYLSLKIWWVLGVAQFSWGNLWSLAGALLILPGLYFVLYKVSREKWVGSGDWLVALMVALVLADWWLALVCVFVANLLGSVVGLVGKKRKLAFGPLLIVGFLVVFFAQNWLVGLINL